jgi:hypothetical protein
MLRLSSSPNPSLLLYCVPPANPYNTQSSTPYECGIKPDDILVIHQITLPKDPATNWTPRHSPEAPHEIHEAIHARIRLDTKHLCNGLSAVTTRIP